MKNRVLGLAAALEMGTGLLLLASPAIVVSLLFGVEISGISLVLGRFGGICLVGLGLACWPGHDNRWPLYGMLTYTLLAMIYLAVVGLSGYAGVLLWPAVVAHAILAILLFRGRFREDKDADDITFNPIRTSASRSSTAGADINGSAHDSHPPQQAEADSAPAAYESLQDGRRRLDGRPAPVVTIPADWPIHGLRL